MNERADTSATGRAHLQREEAQGVATTSASRPEELSSLLGSLAPRAVSVLVSLMQDDGQKPELRMKAAESILDRACGKSGGMLTGEGSGAVIVFEGALEEWSR